MSQNTQQIPSGILNNFPEKIPDEFIIKDLQKKIGQLESYILELEHTIDRLKVEDGRNIRKEIREGEVYKNLKQQLSARKKENESLRRSISDLIQENIRLKTSSSKEKSNDL